MFKYFAAAFLTGAACAMPARATDFVDQSDPVANAFMAGFSQGGLAQSFAPSGSNVSGAGLFLVSGVGTTDTVTISLWTDLPNQFGATLLASASTMGSVGSWADVFWAPVSVAANQTYFLVFSGNNTLGAAGDTQNNYVFGNTYANSSFDSYPGYDYTFRTYSSDAVSPSPEPASWALMVGGFGMVGGALRSRRKTSLSFG
ncbi:MAG TPA: PEPxxWA-CTERM sorting domain-containing protein [Sphingomonas sp.]|uniref:PEPxxWA-CTERM sorting domain-containing protein n=1 Tax=Sphingomonas sp. TaxID=28214 RepID=UPI002CB39367|nr:PEPxxWA-CTERM sorting domain-containing protein [Sphingomonas sp.]HMI20814.1 PEPxxWA-CTERM sorting domain-containing protein [Sphingomonas sp.]